MLCGINVPRIYNITFGLGSAVLGIVGCLMIPFYLVSPSVGLAFGVRSFITVVLGGIGSIPGALVGALIMGQAEALTMGYVSTPMRDAVAFTILILVLLVRPTGIFGEPEKEKA
jgi:branched-chain amino acid transport system permease protein